MTGKAVAVTVDSLVKAYRLGHVEVQALRGLNLKVDAGRMVSIIGPSGSGKTTLLNILGGLDRATAGTVSVGNTQLTSLPPSELVWYRRDTVGHIFQALNLIPTLTAAENVELPMMVAKVKSSARRSRIKELLDVVGLSDRWEHKPDELSGGEQQRVAIAAALANDPPLILADEPTGNLDQKTGLEIVKLLARLKGEKGKTLVVTTHDDRIVEMADVIFHLENGSLGSIDRPARVRN